MQQKASFCVTIIIERNKKEVFLMKIFFLVLALVLMFCGCVSEEPEVFRNPDIQPIVPGYGYQVEPPTIFLPLKNLLENELEIPDNAEIFGTRTEIPVVLPENMESDSNLVPASFWPELVSEIQKDYPDFDPENPGWKANYNFFAVDGTAGMLKINYYIDENIITNKAIIGTIENGIIVRLNYTNIDFETDEEEIRKKAKNFLETTSQTKRIFEEGEEFLKEETLFHYYYPSDMLVYSYQLYFLYGPEGEQIINNDYGYECIVG